ncbi:MAG: methylenetetrahydrofolate reductase [Candidatus Aenigmarchaeota archaeon]|nr:methylenetetrahydrofolate reductase [Candidatus Aenigmarchaeota archaeon]
MKVIEKLKQKKTISLEIEPPALGESIKSLEEFIEPIINKIDFVDITYHPEQIMHIVNYGGRKYPVSQRKKPGTAGVAAAIKNKYGVEPVPHVICTGFNAFETEEFLVELNYLDIENVLALRGDYPKDANGSKMPFPRIPHGNRHANELILQITALKKGIYFGADQGTPLNFCIGAACYPEKHTKNKTWKDELFWLKTKVDAGAEYLVTQMFFENKKYIEFVQHAKEAGINVPIIPGIKPLVAYKQLYSLPENFGCAIPQVLRKEVAEHPTAAKEIGIEWCANQCRELLKYGVPGLHFYAARKSPIKQVLEKII